MIAGEPIKAVAQVSKQGFLFVFDRITGEPIWPIVETAVPASTVPGERVAPTQPIPSWPPPFVRQGSSVEALIDPYSADGYDTGPLYTPPPPKVSSSPQARAAAPFGVVLRSIQQHSCFMWPALGR
ncbi:MAG: hypothetical protein CM15mP120_09140 [Pseudomonadota bacterium]|nr:MAG: hypothetical protein CM15mP120_09140 [Pseudomonadota bacterium]